MNTESILSVPLVPSIILVILGFQLYPYSDYEDPTCIRNPTLECIQTIISKFDSTSSVPGAREKKQELGNKYEKFINGQYQKLRENNFDSFDPTEIDEKYVEAQKRANVASRLADRLIQDTKYGGKYSTFSNVRTRFSDTGTQFAEFKIRKIFRNFNPPPAFFSIIDYWTENTWKLKESSDRNKELKHLVYLFMRLGIAEKIEPLLLGIKSISVIHSDSYFHMLRDLKKSSIKFGFDSRKFPPRFRSKALTVLDEEEATRSLLDEKRKLIRHYETLGQESPLAAGRTLDRLKEIARLLVTVGNKEEALAIIDQAYNYESNAYIQSSFISNIEYSILYRSVDVPQKALNLMDEFLNRDDRESCESFNTPRNDIKCATELVYLGLPKVAYRIAANACGRMSDCWGLDELYVAAGSTGADLPDIDSMMGHVPSEVRAKIFLRIAIFYFLEKDGEQVDFFLHKVEEEALDGGANIVDFCNFADVAFFMGRDNVVASFYKRGIHWIFFNVRNHEVRIRLYRRANECFETML